MAATQELVVKVRADTAQAETGLGRLSRILDVTLGIGLYDAARRIGAGMINLGKDAIKAAADIETQKIGFKTLLGTMEEADAAIKMIQKDAASTPFEFAGLVEANKALTLVTKNAQKSEQVLLDVGKALAASGKGQAELDRIIMNLQQIGNTGKITEMDIRQFGYAGINILELLAVHYGTTKEKAGEMVKDSKDAFADLSAAFEKAGAEGGQFADAFANAAGSANQLASNLSDSWNIFLTGAGSFLIEWYKQVLVLMIDFINKLPEIINNIKKFADDILITFTALGIDWEAIWLQMRFIIESVILWIKENIVPTVSFIVTTIIELIVFLKQKWDENFLGIKSTFMFIFGSIIEFLKIWFNLAKMSLEIGLAILRGDWDGAWNALKDGTFAIWEGIKNIITGAIDYLSGIIKSFMDMVKNAINAAKEFLGIRGQQEIWNERQAEFTPKFAKGGIVPELHNSIKRFASGGMAGDTVPAMLSPGEVILNAAQQRNVAGKLSGITINITGNTLLDDSAAQKIGDMITQRLSFHMAV